MPEGDYTIVFEKLADAVKSEDLDSRLDAFADVSPEELDEIAELRRMVDEFAAPAPTSFTTT